MLFALTGSSAAGKSAVLPRLAARVEGLEAHDFNELSVPRGASRRWRQEATEEWTRRTVASHSGRDTLIAGQTPIGEWLAVPSATELDGIAVCLLDVRDRIRAVRLGQLPAAHVPLDDPTPTSPRLGVLASCTCGRSAMAPRRDREGGWERMRWQRWQHWERGDRRWDVLRLETSVAPIEETVEELARWIVERREISPLRNAGSRGKLAGVALDGPALERGFDLSGGSGAAALHRRRSALSELLASFAAPA